MVLRGVLAVVLLVLRLGPSHGTPLMEENESVVHHLSPEVVQQLLAVTNNTLHHVQDVKSLLTPLQENKASVEVSGSAGGVLRRDISMQLLLLLLETEQARDCHDLLLAGNTRSGVYQIFPYRCRRQEEGVQVWCELEGEEGGWTVVLARRPLDQQVNFNRGWREYREGFGDPDTEYWIGNAVLHDLTYRWPQVLKVDLGDWDGKSRSVRYQTFLVDDEDSQFRLHLGQYSGDAGDAFSYHDNMPFTTSDRDNDKHGTVNCALSHHGGFWYNSCHYVSPTSQLLEKQKSTIGINWYTWYTDRTTLKNATFMIKPKSCSY